MYLLEDKYNFIWIVIMISCQQGIECSVRILKLQGTRSEARAGERHKNGVQV